MKLRRYRRSLGLVLAVAFISLSRPSLVLGEVQSFTADQVVARMVMVDSERSAKTQGYTASRHYTLDYKGFPGDKHAEMVVQVVSNPAQKQFTIVSESGSKLLLNRVLHKLLDSESEASTAKNRAEVKLTPENYHFVLAGMDTVQGRNCYVLQVEPKRDSKFLYKGKVWIDAQDFAVTQISARPAKNPSFWISSVQIEHEYKKHGELWLPLINRSTSKVRLGGNAVLTIDYQQYNFPTGTSAEVTSTDK